MYLEDIAKEIRKQVPKAKLPKKNADLLFRIYAVLLRAKGQAVTPSDVHDAWAAWMSKIDSTHVSLVEYNALDKKVQEEDQVYLEAIQTVASTMASKEAPHAKFGNLLFPTGPLKTPEDMNQAIELYKIMVQSSENLVNRRQALNTFFLTINGILMTAAGVILQSSNGDRVTALGIAALGIAGVILCSAWRSLILSFGQLNTGKFKVINTIERYLKVAIYTAEWEALERGEKPNIYRSFTSREIWVPNALFFIHLLVIIFALFYFAYGYALPIFKSIT